MNYTDKEITPGLVMHLCPRVMLGKGGKVSCAPQFIVRDHHFFLVVEVDDKRCRLVPLFSEPSQGRVAISTEGRTGHPLWLNGTFHHHVDQTWDVSKPVVIQAAKAAHDQSQPGARNRLDPAFLPAV